MGVIVRGIKNAFRNVVRTLSVTIILAISIGLALVMLLAYQTVNDRISSVQSSIGNTISISPAGARGFEGGGEPLTQAQMDTVKSIAHVTGINATLQDRLETGTNTNLASAIDPGTLGNRFNARSGGGNQSFSVSGQAAPNGGSGTFKLPIMATGIGDSSVITSNGSKIANGGVFDATGTANEAVIGTTIATKNSLSVGSTFTAYSTTITVKGIYDAGNQFGNDQIYFPIKTLQTLSGQDGQISSATATVDSISNLDATTTAIKNSLGVDKADVTNTADQAKNAITPLENIKTTSLYSLIGALVAGAVITLLIMVIIVRERRREIGVLKAIGSTNIGVVTQFVTESFVLTLLGGVVGIIAGISLSNPVLNALVSSSTSSSGAAGAVRIAGGAGGGFARVVQFGGQFGGGFRSALQNLSTSVGPMVIVYGILAAIVIAILGSALPAFLIAKVKPAEVMRGE